MMKERRKRQVLSWSTFFWCTLFVVFSCLLFTFSFFHLFSTERFRPELVSRWKREGGAMMKAMISGDPQTPPTVSIRETVILPDQVLIFLQYHPPFSLLFTKHHFNCLYFASNSSSSPHLILPPNHVDHHDHYDQIVRCQLPPHGLVTTTSLALKSAEDGYIQPGGTTEYRWDSLVYEAMIDSDNITVVFVKGLNLRPDKLYEPSRFECVYGWDFRSHRHKLLLRSDVISVAQEIVRCRTPSSVSAFLLLRSNSSIKVSIRVKGRGTFRSVARLRFKTTSGFQFGPVPGPTQKRYDMCVCTMLRNQARFLKEWIVYHGRIGVQRWFIYDNNSDDDVEEVIESLVKRNFDISRHVWPWVKTQESGFAHCALRTRGLCDWVGFIDVDEYLHVPELGMLLIDVIRNQSQYNNIVAELRVSCHSFGPSGLKIAPMQGVTTGYTCRLAMPERHKSIVKPEALNSTLINVVHHFHLRDGFHFVNADRGVLVINHYKYQVWDVFKEKFYRRVATYVADWQNEQNVGSKDRAPGLGTRAVEPPDWSSRFCEVTDTGLRDMVLRNFMDPSTNLLPWQEDSKTIIKEQYRIVEKQRKTT